MDVRFVLCVGHRIAEKQHEVDLVVGYARRDLLFAALHTRKALVDFQTGSFFNKFAGGAGGTHLVAADNATVGNAKLHQQFFFGVMCNQCNIHNAPPFLSGWSGG